jgi:membrane associated rhomboid family serine protease
MSYEQYRPQSFRILPTVVKNLLIINGLFYLATMVIENKFNIELSNYLGLHYFKSEFFKPYQLVTYMFMHGSLEHVFFNMFALWMFGNVLENFWGPKKFLTYYMVCGIGAGLIQLAVTHIRLTMLLSDLPPESIDYIITKGFEIFQSGQNFIDPVAAQINIMINISTVGASGAVFGILLAYGMLFPNTLLYIYFAIPMKAKWFVILYGAVELFMGIANSQGDNVAHFAHLGGMLFGFIMIKYWQKNRKNIY